MGREMQKRKNRSSIPKKRQKPKSKKQLLRNPIIAANWNQSQTPSQNYRRIGLVRQLNKAAGGKEKTVASLLEDGSDNDGQDDPLAINSAKQVEQAIVKEAVIERDPDTGAIIRVVDSAKPNPLNDSMNELEDVDTLNFNALGRLPKRDQGLDKNTDVTRQLEAWAANGEVSKPREQSAREAEWVEQLVKKHGDDYKAMFWDKRLNVFQQSEGDLKRRVKKWKAKGR